MSGQEDLGGSVRVESVCGEMAGYQFAYTWEGPALENSPRGDKDLLPKSIKGPTQYKVLLEGMFEQTPVSLNIENSRRSIILALPRRVPYHHSPVVENSAAAVQQAAPAAGNEAASGPCQSGWTTGLKHQDSSHRGKDNPAGSALQQQHRVL